MTRLKKALSTITLSATTTLAMAHPGHDHDAANSGLMHVLFYGAIVALGVAVVWLIVRSFNKKT